MRKFVEPDVADNPLYHDTWKLLKKYRDVVWSLELSVQHVRTKFEIEYGTSIEDFLDSVYLAGADLAGSDIEHHAKCIERSHKMLKLLDSAIELLRTKHKNGEAYYWLLYYSFLSPQQLKNVEEIIETLSCFFQFQRSERNGDRHHEDPQFPLHWNTPCALRHLRDLQQQQRPDEVALQIGNAGQGIDLERNLPTAPVPTVSP